MKTDAAEYTAKRKLIARRDAVRAENKQRRVEGLPLLKLPDDRWAPMRSNNGFDGGPGLDAVSSDSYDHLTAPGGALGQRKKRRRLLEKEKLSYEGRKDQRRLNSKAELSEVILPYNPLLALSGETSTVSYGSDAGYSGSESFEADRVSQAVRSI